MKLRTLWGLLAVLVLLSVPLGCPVDVDDDSPPDDDTAGDDDSASVCSGFVDCAAFGDGGGPYNVDRGDEATFPVQFAEELASHSLVFATSTTDIPDFTTRVSHADLWNFDLTLNLSANSSNPNETGQYGFDWMAAPKDGEFSDIQQGEGSFSYNIDRGGGVTTSYSFDTALGAAPVVLVTSTERASDFSIGVSNKTTAGFDLDFNLSANSSEASAEGPNTFNWIAFSSQLQEPDLQVGSDQVQYNLSRGDSTTGQVNFPTAFGQVPRVFITATTDSRDLYISTTNKSADGFSVVVHLSGNSSQPTAAGTFTFDWVAASPDP